MNSAQTLKKVQSITNLPTLSAIALEVNRLLQDFDSPIDPLVQLLEKDQTLVMKILKLVNSSFYGFKRRVNNVHHAVTLMGYNTIRNAVITVAVIDALTLMREFKGFDIGIFWRHAIRTAVLSRFLALKTHLVPVEDAFSAGLLHDIGKVVLANYFPAELAIILDEMRQKEVAFFQAESILGACTHGMIGGHLARQWLLSEPLVATIQNHHLPVQAEEDDTLTLLIGLANNLEHMMAGDNGYQLSLEKMPDKVRLVTLDILKAGGQWLADIKCDMDAACSFFNKG